MIFLPHERLIEARTSAYLDRSWRLDIGLFTSFDPNVQAKENRPNDQYDSVYPFSMVQLWADGSIGELYYLFSHL